MAQPYLPSFSELNQGGQAALGTTQPGTNYARNEGLDLLFRAATNQSAQRWQKKQEIDRRKEDVFKNLRDLSAVAYMPEDRGVIKEKMSKAISLISPNVFNGTDDAAWQAFNTAALDYSNAVNRSKQDLLNYEIDKKTIQDNPEFANRPNEDYLSAYVKAPLGERTYNRLIPTPVFDFKPLALAASQGAVTGIAGDELEVGDLAMQNGQQVFTPSKNGRYQRTLSGGTNVNLDQYRGQFDELVSNPAYSPKVHRYLDYVYQYELSPEQKKAATNADGTPNYTLLTENIRESLAPTATARTAKYDESQFALQAQKDAADLQQEAMRQAGMDRRAKWDNEAQVTAASKKGDKTAQQLTTDATTFADSIYNRVSNSNIKIGSRNVRAIPVAQLSPEEQQVLGLTGKSNTGETTYPFGNRSGNDGLYVYLGTKGGLALAKFNDSDDKFETKTSFSKDNLKSARITFALKQGAGKEYGAYGELNPEGLPAPASSSTETITTTTTTNKQESLRNKYNY